MSFQAIMSLVTSGCWLVAVIFLVLANRTLRIWLSTLDARVRELERRDLEREARRVGCARSGVSITVSEIRDVRGEHIPDHVVDDSLSTTVRAASGAGLSHSVSPASEDPIGGVSAAPKPAEDAR